MMNTKSHHFVLAKSVGEDDGEPRVLCVPTTYATYDSGKIYKMLPNPGPIILY